MGIYSTPSTRSSMPVHVPFRTIENPPAPTENLLHALDAVLHVGVQLPQAVDDVVRCLPVAAPVCFQEGRHLG